MSVNVSVARPHFDGRSAPARCAPEQYCNNSKIYRLKQWIFTVKH